MTPDAVHAYAELQLRDDDGRAITAAEHHRLWVDLLTDTRIRKLLVIAPPESAKTTWVTSAYLGCRLGFHPQQSVILGSAAGEIAEKRSLSLRSMIESPEWQQTFPGILPVKANRAMKWSTTEWSLAPNGRPTLGRLHPSIAAYGTGGAIIGSRGDEVLGDDLLDFDNSRTQHQRGLILDWAHRSFLSRLKARVGRAVIIGTAWFPGDLYDVFRHAGDWVVCHMPLLAEGDEVRAILSYPDNFPDEWCLGRPVSPYQAQDALAS